MSIQTFSKHLYFSPRFYVTVSKTSNIIILILERTEIIILSRLYLYWKISEWGNYTKFHPWNACSGEIGHQPKYITKLIALFAWCICIETTKLPGPRDFLKSLCGHQKIKGPSKVTSQSPLLFFFHNHIKLGI